MKRTWKLWMAATFGLGVVQPVVAAEPAPAAPSAEKKSSEEKPATEAAPASNVVPASALPPPVQVPNGSEFMESVNLRQRFAGPYSPMPYSGGQQQWCPPNPYFPSQPQPYPYPYPYPNPIPNPNPQQPQAPAADTTFQARQGGTEGAHTNSPNMFGDLFGAKASIVTLPGVRTVTMPGVLNGATGQFHLPASGPVPGLVVAPAGTVGFGTLSVLPGASFPVRIGSSVSENITALNVNQPPNSAGTVNGVLSANFAPGTPGFQLASNFERSRNPQATLNSLTINATQVQFTGSDLIYQATVNDTVTTTVPTQVRYAVPTPGAGGTVGLLKVAEDNSPFPRDRIIYTYDYFNNVPIGFGGLPVNRFQFGFEKTFFDGRMSFEVRAPFASTLSSSSALNGDTLGMEFGNVRLLAKALFFQRSKINISGGLGISLPTAEDISVGDGTGTELVRVNNRSCQLAPFIAGIWTPNERLFAQSWYGFTFDTGGNGVQVNPAIFGVGPNIGSLTSPTLMTFDTQIGYWLFLSQQGLVRGVAPFIELHYSGDVGQGTLLQVNNFAIGDVTTYQEFNLTAGITTRLGQNTTLAVGAAAPLLGQSGRTFDAQIGVRLNWYFGYTARQRANNMSPNSF